jgi:hypothetical protein
MAGYTLYDHKTNDYIRRELRITGILDKIDEYRRNWFFTFSKNATKPNPFEIIPLQTTRKENNWKTEEALARAAVNSGDETDQRVQSLMFMMTRDLVRLKLMAYLVSGSINNQDGAYFCEPRSRYLILRAST